MATSVQTLVVVLAAITAAWLVLSVVILRRARHRRHQVAVLQARPRRQAREEAGRFVPLTPVGAARLEESERMAEPEPEPEPESEPEVDAEPLPPHPGDLTAATTYEIVWYRDGDRIAFALQPIDGRAAPWARYRSASFAWEEDSDPPADVVAAQRAHGRLRTRLTRDGWRPAGRGDAWFRHRFMPPETPPEP